MSTTVIIAITGGAGRISYSLIPLLCDGSIFGKETRVVLRLIDMEAAMSRLKGLQMEIQDSAYELLDAVWIGTSAEEGFAGAHVAVLLGGFPRLPGMERKDLITKNAEGMRDQARALEACADRNVKVIVVANPANTNALVAMKSAPSIPATNFTCLTRLDHERLRGFVLAQVNATEEAARVRPSDVAGIAIFGNHSTTQVPYIDAATVTVGGATKNVAQYFSADEAAQLTSSVQNRGGEVIKAQQASSALSAANAVAKHLKDWLRPTDTSNVFSMGVLSDGNPYGIADGLCFSFPCRATGNGEYAIVPNLPISDTVRTMLQLSVDELTAEKTDAEEIVGPLVFPSKL